MTNIPYDNIMRHCCERIDKESCGLLVKNNGVISYIPCRNVSQSPTNSFVLNQEDYAEAEDNNDSIVAVVHSHIDNNINPSEWDIASFNNGNLDWLIVTPDGQLRWMYKQTKQDVPLYGREYIWHVYDCGSFIIDFYKQEFDITIPDFYRQDKFWEKKEERYFEVYERAGFYEIEMSTLQYGDVILMALGTDVACHGAVYLGNNQIGHHVNGRLSHKAVYGKYYMDRTKKCLRHKERK